MSTIIPAIIPKSLDDLADKVSLIQDLAPGVQIDVVDITFAPTPSWPCREAKEIQELKTIEISTLFETTALEVDLMVAKPEEQIELWVAAGASRIVLHEQNPVLLKYLITTLQTKYGHTKGVPVGLSIGIAIHQESDFTMFESVFGSIDFVQFMGITSIGKQGEPFNVDVVEKIKDFIAQHPNIPVQVDGGVSLETAPLLLSAGASRLIVGSALWRSQNIQSMYGEFVDITSKYGMYN